MRDAQPTLRSPYEVWDRVDPLGADLDADPVVAGLAAKYSTRAYEGYFNTDYLIPSVFFQRGMDPKGIPKYSKLDLQYIHDAQPDPDAHAELMVGKSATWYDVRRNIDRLPNFANPERDAGLPKQVRGRLADWLDERLKSRL